MVRTLTDLGVVITIITTAAVAAAQPARAGRTKNGIAYDVQGEGPVVLVTGSNLDRRMWSREAVWLGSTRTVVRYDLRAHGASETATMPFSHVDDLFTLLDEIGVQRATLIGLSAGSTIALDAALLSPTRFDRLVLVGQHQRLCPKNTATVHGGSDRCIPAAQLQESKRSATRIFGLRGAQRVTGARSSEGDRE
jgi:pimeloyl-ACP methyl ester carboxylesterase